MSLEGLLDLDTYLGFLRRLARGEITVPERDEWLALVDGDQDKLERVLLAVGKALADRQETVLYPVDMIVVPRYPLSKQPMVKWRELARSDPLSASVSRIRALCSALGPRINAGFVLRGWVLIDIDAKVELRSVTPDIETRRGLHILRKIKGGEAIEIRLSNSRGYKICIVTPKGRVEIMSGPLFLGSVPMQSRYLTKSGSKIICRKYHLISNEARIAFESADTSVLEASPEEVREVIATILEELGRGDATKSLELRAVEKVEPNTIGSNVTPPESRFNTSAIPLLGTLSYEEFKNLLSCNIERLPRCLRAALFEDVPKGYRWFHLRLLAAVLPYFVFMDRHNIEEIVADFSSRSSSTPGDCRKWLYDLRYFSGKIALEGEVIHSPSKLGLPSEAWSAFEELGYCANCPLREVCRSRSGGARRRSIVSYLEELIANSTRERI